MFRNLAKSTLFSLIYELENNIHSAIIVLKRLVCPNIYIDCNYSKMLKYKRRWQHGRKNNKSEKAQTD